MPAQSNTPKGSSRKVGRNTGKTGLYAASHRRERNRMRRMEKRIKSFKLSPDYYVIDAQCGVKRATVAQRGDAIIRQIIDAQ